MDLVTCKIALASDFDQVVIRHNMPWPEIAIIQKIHGEESVHDVEKTGEIDGVEPYDVKRELSLRYDPDVVASVYPGRDPNMRMEAPAPKVLTRAAPKTAPSRGASA